MGRAAELSRVAEIMTRVEAGQPWLIAIEGDPGMGKTTLARRCLSDALTEARNDPDSQHVAAMSAGRLAGTYILLGDGE